MDADAGCCDSASASSTFEATEDVDERKDGGDPTRLPAFIVPCGDTGDGGSYPGCCTPNNQIGSVHLSGVASLSNKYRIALSKCPFPCFATVSSADALLLGEDWERRVLSERSVVDELNVCENQPERRVGRSPIRVDDGAVLEEESW